MQIAATTSQAALTASPRLSATIPNAIAPSAATAVHKSFVCSVRELLSLTLIDASRNAAMDKHNSHAADDIDQAQNVFILLLNNCGTNGSPGGVGARSIHEVTSSSSLFIDEFA